VNAVESPEFLPPLPFVPCPMGGSNHATTPGTAYIDSPQRGKPGPIT
jgi:hypothetical protein